MNKISIFEIKSQFGNFYLSKDVIDIFKSLETLNYQNFSLYGELHAAVLLNNNLFDEYRSFVNKFNNIFLQYFEKDVSDYHSILTNYDFFKGMSSPSFLVKDKTDLFNDMTFKNESKLKETLFYVFESWLVGPGEVMNVKQEQVIGYGQSDISISDIENKNYALELKKDKARRKDVYQTYEYTLKDSGYDGVLIAAEFNEIIIDLANHLGITLYEYDFGYSINKETKKRTETPEFVWLEKINFKNQSTPFDELLNEIQSCDGFYVDFHKDKPSDAYESILERNTAYSNAISEACQAVIEKHGIPS
jgi:hypothetical protein